MKIPNPRSENSENTNMKESTMKTRMLSVIATLMLAITPALAHSDHELGPNGGRILEFSKDQSLHGEVTLTNGMFRVAVLDKNMKPVALTDQSLVVTGGSRSKPEKPKIERQGDRFVFPALTGDSYLLVFQFKENSKAKTITARFEYDASVCGGCQRAEWLCDCGKKTKK
jgi:hypothetical protein